LIVFDKAKRRYAIDYLAINILLTADTVTSGTPFLNWKILEVDFS